MPPTRQGSEAFLLEGGTRYATRRAKRFGSSVKILGSRLKHLGC